MEIPVAPNLHVKKAKLLAVHREILRSNSQESVSSNQALPNGTIKEEIELPAEESNQNDTTTTINNQNKNNLELVDSGSNNSNEMVNIITDSSPERLRTEDNQSSLWSTMESDQVEVIGGQVEVIGGHRAAVVVEQKPELEEAETKSTIIPIPIPVTTKTKKKKEKASHGCPICGFQGKSRIELNKHLSKAHNLIPPFKCNHVEKGN